MDWFVGGPLLYFAFALFVYKTVASIVTFSKMPRHLRWDIHPVPHHGLAGSKYQKVDFAELKPHVSLYHELIEMGQEMLFIKRAFINNPKVWKGSFPLHAGLYLGTAWLVLLFVGAVFELSGIPVHAASSNALAVMVFYLTNVAGPLAFVAGLGGSLVLLWLRTMDEDMRFISDVVSFVNLGVMIFLFGTGLLAWWLADPVFQIVRGHAAGLLALSPQTVGHPLVVLQMFAFCLFLIYLPFSRMMHFVAKYYFYHNIMWDDEMMKRGSALEQDITAYLQQKTTWAAPHIRPGATWGEQAMGGLPKEGEKP